MTIMDFLSKIDAMSFGLGILCCMILDIMFAFLNWMIEKAKKERDEER